MSSDEVFRFFCQLALNNKRRAFNLFNYIAL